MPRWLPLLATVLLFWLIEIILLLVAMIVGAQFGSGVPFGWLFGSLIGLALFAPGILGFVMATVIMPVCLIEHRGPIASFWRSAALTKGYRWQVVGTYLAYYAVIVIVGLILWAVASRTVGPSFSGLITLPFNIFTACYGSVLLAAIYHDLRVAKDGIGTDHLAAVFD